MSWKMNIHESDMPNCCDEGKGICGKCSCCNHTYCDICNESAHDGNCDFMNEKSIQAPLDIRHYKFIDEKWVEQNDTK